MWSYGRWLRAAVIPIALMLAAAAAPSPAHFLTPGSAVDAFITALRTGDERMLVALFSAHGVQVIRSGDPVADRAARQKFLGAYDDSHQVAIEGNSATLEVGAGNWPFPIPLRHAAQGWRFDIAAGEEEILDRRVGANELATQQVMLAYVDAQNEYAQSLHDGLKLHVYAQKLLSTPGKQDGLYWPTEPEQPPSPLGELVADARASGYHPGESTEPQPFHGYLYRILKAQGPHAAGGAYDYMVRGMMLGGFGLIAWPAKWGNSGVQTFIVNQDGELYAKDLERRTGELAPGVTRFDPGPGWHKIGTPEPSAGSMLQ